MKWPGATPVSFLNGANQLSSVRTVPGARLPVAYPHELVVFRLSWECGDDVEAVRDADDSKGERMLLSFEAGVVRASQDRLQLSHGCVGSVRSVHEAPEFVSEQDYLVDIVEGSAHRPPSKAALEEGITDQPSLSEAIRDFTVEPLGTLPLRRGQVEGCVELMKAVLTDTARYIS